MSLSSIFDLDEFSGYRTAWDTRVAELTRRRSYYDGAAYNTVRQTLGVLWPRLYKGVKPLYLPISRAVDVDAGTVPGGWKLPDGTTDQPYNKAWQDAVNQIFDWSDWNVDGVLFVHFGAQYGVSGLKVSDLRDYGVIQIKPVIPTKFMLVKSSDYNQRVAMSIYIEKRHNRSGEEYEYAEIITPEMIRTFNNGRPEMYDGREAEYPNELGEVPYIEVEHIRTGEPFGECTYQKAIPMLNEVNELASYLADIIKKHAEPQWAVIGAEPSDLVKSGDNVWHIPAGGDAKPLVAQIDIAGALEFVKEIRDQVYGSLPELAFDELRSKTQIATATLELQLMDFTLKIKRCRPNYDHGLADALRISGLAAAGMGLSDLAVLDDESFAFDQERDILPVDKETAIRIEMQSLALEQQRAIVDSGVNSEKES